MRTPNRDAPGNHRASFSPQLYYRENKMRKQRLRTVIRESAAANCFLFALYAASLIAIIRGVFADTEN